MSIDFSLIARAALAGLSQLVQEWLPGGQKVGHEYKAARRADGGPGDSLSVNLNTGAWAHFASGSSGGDAISLYAYLFTSGDQARAARELAERLGVSAQGAAGAAPPAAPKKPRSEWAPIVPVPEDAPAFRLAHTHYGAPQARWEYRTQAGELVGYVCRFQKSGGGKEILPASWAVNTKGEHAWRWLSFPKPRPLYRLPELAAKPGAPVLLVEGEKTADAAATLFPMMAVLSWPGGSKAVKHAHWAALEGRKVFVWPDADEPGSAAARQIAEVLRGVAESVRLITPPSDVPHGWDLADALEDGWTPERAQAWAKANIARTGGEKSPNPSRARAGGVEDWRAGVHWVYAGRSGYKDCRENAIYMLQHHPAWSGVLAADVFAKRIIVTRDSPLGQKAGDEWGEQDDVELGLWLQQHEDLVMRSLETIAHAVRFVAGKAAVHPVRDYLDALRWDEQLRVDAWAPRYLGSPDTHYTRLVGRFFLINLVRRIYEPGCVMRSVPVLEGSQNIGKSRALRTLAHPWFSDTQFKVGDKDAFMAIRGCWLYEISELESFTRAEATAVKAFISSQEDNFRAPYERANTKHPRETMFAGTTNAIEYLKDWSGNTRFWPLEVDQVRLEELAAVRDQLLAEAVRLYRAGERTYPTLEQERELFKPEQDRRMVAHPWFDAIEDHLAQHTFETVSVAEIVSECLGIKLDKVNPQGSESQKVGQILKSLGWTKQRMSEGAGRGWRWVRPKAQKQETTTREPISAGEANKGDEDDDIPF